MKNRKKNTQKLNQTQDKPKKKTNSNRRVEKTLQSRQKSEKQN